MSYLMYVLACLLLALIFDPINAKPKRVGTRPIKAGEKPPAPSPPPSPPTNDNQPPKRVDETRWGSRFQHRGHYHNRYWTRPPRR